ncbi:hypothetical protein ACTFIR_000718 [Dictyostelium discoideum]
MSNIYKQ